MNDPKARPVSWQFVNFEFAKIVPRLYGELKILSVKSAKKLRKIEHGGIAQLGERLNGIQEVSGSIPLISTNSTKKAWLFWSNYYKKLRNWIPRKTGPGYTLEYVLGLFFYMEQKFGDLAGWFCHINRRQRRFVHWI